MTTINKIPKWVKECSVECDNIFSFADKYRKPERFSDRGKEYVNVIMARHRIELDELGYTWISKHESITGKLVCYIGKKTDW